jgi:membrane protein required for colicin V production
VEFGEFIGGIQTVDLLLVLYFMGFFVLGFAQGTIRRLIGIGSILFSFFFAANLAEPLGEFLGANWTQFPKEYSYMIGFLTVFVAAALAFALVAQGWYKPQPLFEKARFVDEVLGGLLGLVQAGLILGCLTVILGSFFLNRSIIPDPQEISFLRDLWNALESSKIVDVFQETLIPAFFVLTGFLVPSEIVAPYRVTSS